MDPKTQKLLEDLAKRNAEAALAVGATADPDVHAPAQVDPVVQEALDSYKPSPEPSITPKEDGTYDVKLGGALKGATIPYTPVAPVAGEEEAPLSFYDMLLRNEEVRKKASDAYERNEKSNRARSTIASIADALSSLGNLVGTTYGAFNQPQTYQTPFITEQVEADRARARQLAQALYERDNSLRLAKMKMDATQAGYDRQLAVQDAITQRAYMNAMARADLAEKNAAHKSEQIAQQGEIRKDIAQMNNESSERRTAKTAGVSRANALTRDAFNRDKLEAQKNGEIGGGSNGVGGYVTETNIEYNDMGQKVRETKSRTGKNGNTTTTTTTKKPNPMGSAPQQEGKKKKKNPMN